MLEYTLALKRQGVAKHIGLYVGHSSRVTFGVNSDHFLKALNKWSL